MTTAIKLPTDKFDTTMTFVRPDPAPTRAPLEKLAVLPGFNTRVKDAEYNERVAGVAESIVANGFFDDKPFAVVMIPGDDTIYIYDGEHRFDAAKQALLDGAEFPDGLPIAWAKDGATVRDLTIHLAHGNNGERLNMVELAAVVRRMQGLDMTKEEIATALGRTTRHVDNLFVLAAANATVKKAVASGQIAGAEAVKLLRKDPKTAGDKITEAVRKAAEKGKAKATPKTMTASEPTGPKMKAIPVEQSMPEGETMGAILKALATKIREHVQIGEGDLLLETGMIRVKIEVIDREAEEAKAQREREKAEAAAKREAEKVEREKAKAAEAEKKAKEKAEREKAKKAEAAKKAKEKEAKAKKAAAEKAAAEKAQAKLLAEAAKGKPANGGKTPAKGKTDAPAQKPKNAPKAAPATEQPETPENAPSGPESGTEQASDLPADSMGGL